MTCVLILKILEKFFNSNYVLISVLALFFSQYLFYYTFTDPSSSHIPEIFLITFGLYLIINKILKLNTKSNLNEAIKNSSENKYWYISGFILALAVNVRIDAIIIFVTLSIGLYLLKANKELLKKLIIGFFLGIIPMFIFSYFAYGNILNTGLSIFADDPTFSLEYFSMFNILFHPIRGLFLWSPLTIISIIGLIIGLKKRRILLNTYLSFH